MKATAIARIELVRLFRDRSNIFFVLVLPILLVVLIGAMFGGAAETRVGVVAPTGDDAVTELVAALEDAGNVQVVVVDDEDELVAEVSRGHLAAGVVVPVGFADDLDAGRSVALGYIGREDTTAMSVRALVEAAVADQAAVVGAAQAAGAATGEPVADLVRLAARVQPAVPGIEVGVEAVGGDELAQEFAGLGQFDIGASSQLFLFVFLTSMTSGAALIQTRQLGVARRMLGTPTSAATILAGQAGGRLLVALFQAAYIVAATALLFAVNWGDPLATAAVVLVFGLVSAGAGMLVGSVFKNDSQAGGVGVGLGLVFAALGGAMMPLELYSDTMRAVAHVTPHAWANEAMAEIVRRDGGIIDVLPQLGALAVYAAVVLGLASWLLRRALTR